VRTTRRSSSAPSTTSARSRARHRSPHRPHQDQRRRAGQRPREGRPGQGRRARPQHRWQAADPRRPQRQCPHDHHPRPRRAHLHGRARQPPRRARRPHEPRRRGSGRRPGVELVHELIDEVRAAATTPILGIGVGTPGIVDQTGTIRWAVSLDWQDLPLAQILQERHALPTVVANDSRAAAFATYLFKGDARPANLAVIKVGRGIGAGLILKDQLFGGDNEAAGEIGHVVVDRDGDACHCGRYGCLETVASAPAIIRHSGATSLEALAARAEEGDEEALGAVRTAGRALGVRIAHLVATLDVRHIALVGTVTTLGDPWLDAVRDEATSRSLAATGHETVIENGGTGEDVTLLGACALLLTRELGLTVHR
jgi:predicted NBD/HSP70 family sugar kinase